MIKFSVCMSIYGGDKPKYFSDAVNSIIYQTKKPSEIIVVVDGPIDFKMENTLKELKTKYEIIIKYLKKNMGLAYARQIAIETASNELIAVMDSDDISVPDRFEKQINAFLKNKDIDVLGGQICEFVDSIDKVVGIRKVPIKDSDIKHYLKQRCPLNHVTVMFKKTSVLNAGGYIDWFYNEDYYLWIRMYENGCQFQNLQYNLVYVRVGKEMYTRRGGVKYFLSEISLQKYMLNKNIINVTKYINNIIIRLFVQVILPNRLRAWCFKMLFRKKHYK